MLAKTSPMAKIADGNDDEIDASQQRSLTEGEARGRAEQIGAHRGDPQADQHRQQPLGQRFTRQQNDHRKAEHHQRKILRRTERERQLRERWRYQHQSDHPKRAGDERRDRADPERGTRAALARHLITVEAGDDRSRLAWHVEQDRCGRAAVLRAVVDAGQHDHRAGGLESHRQRQQHRDRCRRTQPRQNTDHRAQQHADDAHRKVGAASARPRSLAAARSACPCRHC